MRKSNPRYWSRNLRFASASLAGMAVLIGCGSASNSPTAGQHEHSQTSPAQVIIEDYLPGAGLQRLAKESDLVVRGDVINTQTGVTFAGAPDAEYTLFTIRVEEVLTGGQLDRIQVFLLTEFGSAPFQPEGRPEMRLGDDGIWMVTQLAPDFGREGYVLTNQNSLLLVDKAGAVSGGSASAAVAREVRKLARVEPLLKYL